MRDPQAALETAWELIEEGAWEEALATLAGLKKAPERWPAEAVARALAGDLVGADRALERARAGLAPDHEDVLWADATLALARWDAPRARASLERLTAASPSGAALDRLALAADLEGDFPRADRLLAEASRLDPERFPVPARLTPEAFDRALKKASDQLPDDFREMLESIPVVVEPMPSRALVAGATAGGLECEILGLFTGHPRPDLPGLPARIYLFQRNLERICRRRSELVEEIRITLYHELAHALGFDEDEVTDLGLE